MYTASSFGDIAGACPLCATEYRMPGVVHPLTTTKQAIHRLRSALDKDGSTLQTKVGKHPVLGCFARRRGWRCSKAVWGGSVFNEMGWESELRNRLQLAYYPTVRARSHEHDVADGHGIVVHHLAPIGNL